LIGSDSTTQGVLLQPTVEEVVTILTIQIVFAVFSEDAIGSSTTIYSVFVVSTVDAIVTT